MLNKHFTRKFETSEDFIEDIAFAFKKSRVLLSASELNIFETIGYRSLSAKDVAEILNLDLKATDRLLNALVGLDLLEKKDLLYTNSEESIKHLIKGSADYIGTIDHLADLWESWSSLTNTIKTGKPVIYQELTEKSDEWLDSFVNSMHWRANLEAPEIISHLNLKGVKRVLDLGGGKGAFTFHLAKQLPSATISLFDLPQITKFTEDYLSVSGVRDRVNIISGDFMKDDIGKGYDMIYLGNVISFRSIWENVALLQKCYDALNHEGQIIISDMIINDNRTKPLNHTLFSLNMLLNTTSGEVYTETDIWIMLREAWFKDIKLTHTHYETAIMSGVR